MFKRLRNDFQQIAKGVSGQAWSAPSRHIVIGKK